MAGCLVHARFDKTVWMAGVGSRSDKTDWRVVVGWFVGWVTFRQRQDLPRLPYLVLPWSSTNYRVRDLLGEANDDKSLLSTLEGGRHS